jgi:ubiquinone/menaquinone biosynthesis C-methylase UbiE
MVIKLFRKFQRFVIQKESLRLAAFDSNESVLDIGCGRGDLINAVGKLNKSLKLFGIDPDAAMIEQAKQLTDKASFKIAYASDLPFINNSFNWVISTLAFHHMPSGEKVQAARELVRVLKPGGHAIVSDFGRPKGIIGTILFAISKKHSFTDQNLEILEPELLKNGMILIKNRRSFGWVEHNLYRKPIAT